jgi:hypothetical protein
MSEGGRTVGLSSTDLAEFALAGPSDPATYIVDTTIRDRNEASAALALLGE